VNKVEYSILNKLLERKKKEQKTSAYKYIGSEISKNSDIVEKEIEANSQICYERVIKSQKKNQLKLNY